MERRPVLGERAEGGGRLARIVFLAEELRYQELLLRRSAPRARAAVVRETAVSYGVGVRPDAPYLERARAEGIATAARGGGGSGLLHQAGDLLWSVVLPRADPRVGRDYVRAYARFGAGVVRALADVGASAHWGRPPGLAEEYCTLSSRGEVLHGGDRIIGGAAQHVTSTALLHHGSLSLSVDRPTVDRLFALPSPGPSARLGSVRDLGVRTPPEELAERIERALAEQLAS